MISAADLMSPPLLGQHLLLAFLLALLTACGNAPEPLTLQGATMGTRYHVTLSTRPETMTVQQLRSGLEEILEGIENSMSTWREDSEVSRFNRAPAGEWLTASPAFLAVFALAREVARRSHGAYDVSVGPLVQLWGFGPAATDSHPSQEQIDAAMQQVGESQVEVDMAAHRLRKLRPLELDFSSVAKGYAVDRLADWLEQQGHSNYMVEIGGEIRVRGRNPRGKNWRIAIERPEPVAREALAILEMSEGAVATSGDYRNFFELDGVRYSHSIDPRSGRPVRHQLVSVTVVHESAALADAWATALTVLGPEQGFSTARSEGLAAYLVSREVGVRRLSGGLPSAGLRVDKTSAIEPYLQ